VAVVLPGSRDEVQAVLRIVNEVRIPVWPVSGGQNFGYGRACAARPGMLLLDLKRMNRILEVNTELAYALVEPGVTFRQLYRYLRDNDIPLWMDCISGSPDGSCLGNITERGAGYTPLGEKFLFSCGMEVVLPNGELLRTGTGTLPNSQTWQLFKWGFGPYLDGLFTQSNYGIVTKAGFWLMPEPPSYEPLAVTMANPGDVYKAVEVLRPLKLNMVIPNGACVTHVRKSLGLTACWGQATGSTTPRHYLLSSRSAITWASGISRGRSTACRRRPGVTAQSSSRPSARRCPTVASSRPKPSRKVPTGGPRSRQCEANHVGISTCLIGLADLVHSGSHRWPRSPVTTLPRRFVSPRRHMPATVSTTRPS
jgi:hypothetical protein